MAIERLQKYLSECSVASRRKSEELIKQGKVKVNGRVAVLGDKVDTKKDTVVVNGKKVVAQKQKYYIMLNKPRGYVTTMSDELGRKCVAELVGDVGATVYPVGRLDRDSEGLLLMTNDGEFANSVMHPSKHIPKTYRVTVRSNVNDAQIMNLETGIDIDGDGRKTLPANVRILEKSAGRSVLEITIFEGRNRQIRKMCEAVSLEVIRLKRNAVGSVKLGMLPTGKWRDLTDDEVHRLKSQ
ncbi:MAG: pseudouridine synthase [Acutalibacteraceae bacterium]